MSGYLEFQHIGMEFPGVKALDDMTFSIDKGEVVAFLGENGAGKSTLLKILNGDYHQTTGKILIDGKEVGFRSPLEAIRAGISVIYQERQLAMYLSVAENIFMGNMPVHGGFIDFRTLNQQAKEIIDEFELPISPDTKVKDLSVAHQQMVEIMKAYSRKSEIICFDEPTAPLTESEIGALFRIIRRLKEMNKVVIYVSHRMKEIFEITDRVVVFKDGKFMALLKTDQTDENELIRLMVGRDIGDVFNTLSRNEQYGETVLELKHVTTKSVKDISFQIRAGEIVGLAGLAGAGRTETARAIFGIDPLLSGEMILNGEPYAPKNPNDAMRKNVALCPEDRKLEGLVLVRNVRENTSLATLDEYTKSGFLALNEEKEFASKSIDLFNIKTPSTEQKVVNLSGGNQQKIILARWMALKPSVIIFDEPTKGIDVGAKSEIYAMICEAAKRGVAVILISSELPEVIGLADRIVIMKDGRITACIDRKDATEQRILKYAMVDEAQSPAEGVGA